MFWWSLKHFKGKLASISKRYYFCVLCYKKKLTINSLLREKLAFSLLSPKKDLITLIINIFEKDFKREKRF